MIPLTNNVHGFFYSFRMSTLSLANFDVFNIAYANIPDGCTTCDTRGTFITGEMQGDGYMTGWVEMIESCNECIGSEKCPGCMQPLTFSFDLSAFAQHDYELLPIRPTSLQVFVTSFGYEDAVSVMPFEGFTCLVCGWTFDPEKLQNDSDPNDYYDYEDGVYDPDD